MMDNMKREERQGEKAKSPLITFISIKLSRENYALHYILEAVT